MKKILVLCTGNSCRSQIAEGYLRFFANGRAEVYSAGIAVHGVHPKATAVMQEVGIDISGYTANHIEEYINMDFDLIITVCDHAKENCPFFPSKAITFHQNFPDPAEMKGSEIEILDEFRRVRDLIEKYCEVFIQEHLS